MLYSRNILGAAWVVVSSNQVISSHGLLALARNVAGLVCVSAKATGRARAHLTARSFANWRARGSSFAPCPGAQLLMVLSHIIFIKQFNYYHIDQDILSAPMASVKVSASATTMLKLKSHSI